MPTAARTTVHRAGPRRAVGAALGGLALALGALGLTACASLADPARPAAVVASTTLETDATSAPVSAPAELTGGLLSVEVVGGMCPSGVECQHVVTLDADGGWRSEDDTGAVVEGRAGADVVAQVTQAVRTADRADLTARAFTGECERHMDGSEVVLTIRPGEADELVLPGCTYVLPRSGPLIEAAVLVRALG